MSSGQQFGLVPSPPGLLAAAWSNVAGTGTATAATYENWSCFKFDAATREYMDFTGQALFYSGSGLTGTLRWFTTTTATNTAVLGLAVRRLANSGDSLIADAQTYDYNYATDSNTATLGSLQYTTITFSDGADMDSLASGESFNVRLVRHATATGDALTVPVYVLVDFSLRET